MLKYLKVHFYYALAHKILYLLMRPLIDRTDKIKLLSICAFVAIYITLWDNYIIYHDAMWYHQDAIVGITIFNVPIEKYLFFITQTISTTLWTSFCSRWSLNSIFLKHSSQFQFQTIRCNVIMLLVAIMYMGWIYAIPATKTFYLGLILCWNMPFIMVLWYFNGPYVCKRFKVTLISVIVPSLYTCYTNVLRARVWKINEATSLEINMFDGLPLEEVVFVTLTNILIVITSHAFDRSKAIIDTYHTDPFPVGRDNGAVSEQRCSYAKLLFNHLVCNEQNFDPTVIGDLEVCSHILHTRSSAHRWAGQYLSNGKINQHQIPGVPIFIVLISLFQVLDRIQSCYTLFVGSSMT